MDPERVLGDMSLAEQLIDRYLDESLDEVSKEPYERALDRMKALFDRFGDENFDKVDQHTVVRVKKIKNPEKLKGLMQAAKQLKLKKSVAAAKAQLASL